MTEIITTLVIAGIFAIIGILGTRYYYKRSEKNERITQKGIKNTRGDIKDLESNLKSSLIELTTEYKKDKVIEYQPQYPVDLSQGATQWDKLKWIEVKPKSQKLFESVAKKLGNRFMDEIVESVFREEEIYECPECGTEIDYDDIECPECGVELEEEEEEEEEEDEY